MIERIEIEFTPEFIKNNYGLYIQRLNLLSFNAMRHGLRVRGFYADYDNEVIVYFAE